VCLQGEVCFVFTLALKLETAKISETFANENCHTILHDQVVNIPVSFLESPHLESWPRDYLS